MNGYIEIHYIQAVANRKPCTGNGKQQIKLEWPWLSSIQTGYTPCTPTLRLVVTWQCNGSAIYSYLDAGRIQRYHHRYVDYEHNIGRASSRLGPDIKTLIICDRYHLSFTMHMYFYSKNCSFG